nr:YihY family inner membrane protein [Anaerolineae bacterium]NIQ79695.1 YihY family inner membrane protein [Anaerolineae bacterium]
KVLAVKTLRLFYVAVRDLSEGQLTLRAMSLVYTTLLSLVPLLAVSFSVLKAFGVHNQIEPVLLNAFAPLGPKGVEIAQNIIGFVENMKVGVLGSIGLGLLIYTVVELIRKIEAAINEIWKIHRPRSFARRFSDYMSVVLIGPVLIFAALGLTATVMSTAVVQELRQIEPFGTAFYVGSKLMPYVLVCAGFAFVYVFVPSTKVRFRSALVGGTFAGILWQTAGWGFAKFIVTSTKYIAIYSGFAILILFMIWLYLNWIILLIGARVTFYHQYPQFLHVKKEFLLLSNRLKERLAFMVMYLVGSNFHWGKKPWTLNSLVDRLGLPIEPVQDVLDNLEKRSLLMESGAEPPEYLPARDIAMIKLGDVLNAVR